MGVHVYSSGSTPPMHKGIASIVCSSEQQPSTAVNNNRLQQASAQLLPRYTPDQLPNAYQS